MKPVRALLFFCPHVRSVDVNQKQTDIATRKWQSKGAERGRVAQVLLCAALGQAGCGRSQCLKEGSAASGGELGLELKGGEN